MLNDGDGYIQCSQGHAHWGRYGAAGALLRHVDPEGRERYLLGLRSPQTHEGGVWGIPGGAIDSHETPHQAALRETEEEFGQLPQLHNVQHVHSNDHGGWAYHTLQADVTHPWEPDLGPDNWETDDARWFTPQEVDELPLHSGFRQTWDQMRNPPQREGFSTSSYSSLPNSVPSKDLPQFSPFVRSPTKVSQLPEGVKTPDPQVPEDHVLQSLDDVAHVLHQRFVQGGLDAPGAVNFAKQSLRSFGYPRDEITVEAAIEAWQTLYPQDMVLPHEGEVPMARHASIADPFTCSSCGSHQLTEPFALGNKMAQRCLVCGITQQSPLSHPSIDRWNENFPQYPEALRSVGPERAWVAKTAGLAEYSEMVPIDAIKHLQEYDRTPGAADAHASPEYWNALKQHIAENGFEDPLTLDYHPNSGTGHLGEGNHRLQIAQELGMTHVPLMIYRTSTPNMHPMHEPGTYRMENHMGFSQFPQYAKPSMIGLPTAGDYAEPESRSWYDTPGSRLGATKPLYHWTNVSDLEQWTDPSHTGPGETYLTEDGDEPGTKWNDDVPRMENPVRITIDPSYLDPSKFDDHYEGWLGNHLYKGPIPPEAIKEIKAFRRPDEWDSTEPTPQDAWPEFGELPPDQHRDINFANNYTSAVSDPWDVSPNEAQAMAHTGQIPGDEHYAGDLDITECNPRSGINKSYLGTAMGQDQQARPVYIKPEESEGLAAERGGFVVARAMGIPVPHTIARNVSIPGHLKQWWADDPAPASVQQSVGGNSLMRSHSTEDFVNEFPEDARRINLLDYVIGNEDRHLGNVVQGDDGRIYPIDHGLAFPMTSHHPTPIGFGRHLIDEPLTEQERALLGQARNVDLAAVGIGRRERNAVQRRIEALLRTNRFYNPKQPGIENPAPGQLAIL